MLPCVERKGLRASVRAAAPAQHGDVGLLAEEGCLKTLHFSERPAVKVCN